MDLVCTKPNCTGQSPIPEDRASLKALRQDCPRCGLPLVLADRYLPLSHLKGRAYLAIDRHSPALRRCVVKVFAPPVGLSPEQQAQAQARFEQEAQLLEQLGNGHPQIPDLYGFFTVSVPRSRQSGGTGAGTTAEPAELFYLVQQYIEGQTLETLSQAAPIGQVEVLGSLVAVLRILKFVHGQGVIHGDIKPANLLRDPSGQLFLIDFGAVKPIAPKVSPKTSPIDANAYAPPELKPGQVSTATDLYALGVTCLALLTGRDPGVFFDGQAWSFRDYCATWDIPLSEAFASVIDRLLLADPTQRLNSVDAVLAALKGGPAAGAAKPEPSPVPNLPASSPDPPPLPTEPAFPEPPPLPSQPSFPEQPAFPEQSAFAEPPPLPTQPSFPEQPAFPDPGPPPALPRVPAQPIAADPAWTQQEPAAAPIAPSSQSEVSQPISQPTRQRSRPTVSRTAPRFSLIELLGNAAFTGAQGTLLAIGLLSLLGTTLLGTGAWLALLALLILAQGLRWIEGIDRWVFLGISLLLVCLWGPLRSIVGYQLGMVVAITLIGAAIGMGAMVIFQLIYRLLLRITDRI
jgi:serine/threonine protein kinase